MPAFSKRSLLVRAQLHPALQKVVDEAIRHYDFTLTTGYRGKADQDAAKAAGFSKAAFGSSPHNFKPSLAFDAYSFPIDVHDTIRQKPLADAILAAAYKVNVGVTWGGNFKSFKDRPHFELTNWKLIATVGA